MMIRYLLLIVTVIFIGCQDGEPDPKMKEAFEIHKAALVKYDSLQSELEALSAQTLTTEGQAALGKLKDASTAWDESLVEVPGFEHEEGHDDHGHHDHDHDHGDESLKDLPPQEMLNLQQALLDEVNKLLKDVRQITVAPVDSL